MSSALSAQRLRLTRGVLGVADVAGTRATARPCVEQIKCTAGSQDEEAEHRMGAGPTLPGGHGADDIITR